MYKSNTYFQYADDGFRLVELGVKSGNRLHSICRLSVDVCKGYLLHLVDTDKNSNTRLPEICNSSLKDISNFVKDNIPKFEYSWTAISKLYKFDVTSNINYYPESFIVSKEEIEDCWLAVFVLRTEMNNYADYLWSTIDPAISGISVNPIEELRKLKGNGGE